MSSWRQLELHPRIVSALEKAGVQSVRDALCMSGPDLQRLTSLSASDVRRLLTAAALLCRAQRPQPVLAADHSGLRLSLGCPVLDGLLRGGLPVGGVTELSGESGVGKTQLALQLCLSVQYPARHGGLDSGAVFVCTEDAFPSRRLQQLIREQRRLRADVPSHVTDGLQFGDRVYVEHAADLTSLQSCLRRRVGLLLARHLVRFVAVDSVASLFRSEFGLSDWLEKSKQLLTLSSTLHHLCHQFNSAVLCINQASFLDCAAGAGLGVGQSGDGSTDAAASSGDGEQGPGEQRPPQIGGRVCASPAPSRTRRRRVEGGRPRTGRRRRAPRLTSFASQETEPDTLTSFRSIGDAKQKTCAGLLHLTSCCLFCPLSLSGDKKHCACVMAA
ncbi:DNA repair protein XRCC3 isoform X1 [Hippocampus zosterae]|uniref:DNA repair protein XRCC3 isoform X1 n=1 Tax=Hippocampus zosterae TaxID=109293 RepID=UPI00223CC4D0|nr:DNA repair protein XRCC3 isoform X1 [Hippocampus zosterae]